MSRKMTAGLLLSAIVMVAQMGVSPAALGQSAKGLRVVSEQTATGFAFPESVAYDPKAKVLYVSQFGSESSASDVSASGNIMSAPASRYALPRR